MGRWNDNNNVMMKKRRFWGDLLVVGCFKLLCVICCSTSLLICGKKGNLADLNRARDLLITTSKKVKKNIKNDDNKSIQAS